MEQQQQQQVSRPAHTVAEDALEVEAAADQDCSTSDPGAAVLQPDSHDAVPPDSAENNNDLNTQADHAHLDTARPEKPANATEFKSVPVQVFADDLDDNECVICWEARAYVLMQPCGHMCVCSGYAAMLRDQLCPMCRSKVLSRLTIKV